VGPVALPKRRFKQAGLPSTATSSYIACSSVRSSTLYPAHSVIIPRYIAVQGRLKGPPREPARSRGRRHGYCQPLSRPRPRLGCPPPRQGRVASHVVARAQLWDFLVTSRWRELRTRCQLSYVCHSIAVTTLQQALILPKSIACIRNDTDHCNRRHVLTQYEVLWADTQISFSYSREYRRRSKEGEAHLGTVFRTSAG
jgi:hypothetical protein